MKRFLPFPAVTGLNHLLTQSGWASPRLVQFAGRTVRFSMAPFSFACTVQSDGLLREAAPDASADAIFTVAPSLLPRLALQDEAAWAQIESRGNAALVQEILFLAHNLRWDAAEDISRVTGDVAAERIVQFAREGHRQARNAATNLSQALTEYWTEERPLLAKPSQIESFTRDVEHLRDAMEKLGQRVSQFVESR
jgi:ubiquinone biosynthesis protein UbiJ